MLLLVFFISSSHCFIVNVGTMHVHVYVYMRFMYVYLTQSVCMPDMIQDETAFKPDLLLTDLADMSFLENINYVL